jgi:hypothetical protein
MAAPARMEPLTSLTSPRVAAAVTVVISFLSPYYYESLIRSYVNMGLTKR